MHIEGEKKDHFCAVVKEKNWTAVAGIMLL